MNSVLGTIMLSIGQIIRETLKLPAPILLVISGIFSGIVMFLIVHIFQVRYVPAAVAAVAGLITIIAVQQRLKVDRSKLRIVITILIVLIHATLTMVTKHYVSYQYFRYTFADTVHKTGNFKLEKYDADSFILLATGKTGFLGFINFEIEQGVTVSSYNHVLVGIKDQDYIFAQIGDFAIIVVIEAFFSLFVENSYQKRKRLARPI